MHAPTALPFSGTDAFIAASSSTASGTMTVTGSLVCSQRYQQNTLCAPPAVLVDLLPLPGRGHNGVTGPRTCSPDITGSCHGT